MDTIHHFDDQLHPDFHFSNDYPNDNPNDYTIDYPIDYHIDYPNDYPNDSPNDNPIDNPNDSPIDNPNDNPIDNPIDLDTTTTPTSTQFFGFSNRKRFTQLHLLNYHFSHILFVESPAKARLFSHFLPSHFFIFPTFGSFFFLPHIKHILSSFHILFFFKPFILFAKRFFLFKHILFATDTDRDGESFSHQLSLICPQGKRIVFNEITKEAILRAIENPVPINKPLVLSQHARLIVDIFIGHKISPFLWKFVYSDKKNSLSAGRCQTPALRLIYENEQCNTGEVETKYKITGNFFSKNIHFQLNYEYDSEENILDFLEKTKNFSHKLTLGNTIESIRHSPEPFNTASLIQSASNTLHISIKETMKLAQQLYQEGYITYIRTEGKKYCAEFLENAKKYILNKWEDPRYLGDFSNLINTNDSNPHEAIRVVHITKPYINCKNEKMKSLYHLIWNNTIHSCMSNAIFQCTTASISAPDEHKYTYTIEIPIFLGWKKNMEKDAITDEQNSGSGLLMFFQSICKSDQPVQYNSIDTSISIQNRDFNYSEASLIKKLVELGIGRPSTYSTIISTIQDRGYVKKCDIPGELIKYTDYSLFDKTVETYKKEKIFGNEKDKLIIQPIGIIVIEFLIEHFDELFSYEYTRNMEEELDKISNTPIELLESSEPWHAICQKCKDDIERLSKPLAKLKKKSYPIDDEYELIFHKFGASLYRHLENGEIEYKNVKKNMKIDIVKLKNKEYTFDDLIEIKNDYLGKYEEEDIYLKSGKFGPYVQWGEKRQSIRNIKKELNEITLSDIVILMDEIKNPGDKPRAPPQIANKNILRVLNSDMSIRKGKFGPYVFYQTVGMKSPAFFSIGKYKKNYATSDSDKMIEWIVSTYINK